MVEALLAKIARALDAAQIPYMVIGGQAVLVYGYTRLTDDIDITLGLPPEGLPKLKSLTLKIGLESLEDDRFVHVNLVLPTEDLASRTRVDFIFSFSDYEKQALQRVERIPFDGYEVAVASVEDLLIQKVVAGRAVDAKDATEILLRHEASIDATYIRTWLTAFDEALATDCVVTFDRLLAEARR